MTDETEPKTTFIAETTSYYAWQAEEPDGEITFHIDIGNVTLHFFLEEWEEFLDLMKIINEKLNNK